MSWVYNVWCTVLFLRFSSYLRKHQIDHITNCCLLSSAKFWQSACTKTTEKQPPLCSTHRTTQKERSQTLCTKKPLTSEITQKEALHSIIWQGCYLVTDTAQYLQILTFIKCDQEGGLAPSLSGHPVFFSFSPCSQEQHWLYLVHFTALVATGLQGAKSISRALRVLWAPSWSIISPKVVTSELEADFPLSYLLLRHIQRNWMNYCFNCFIMFGAENLRILRNQSILETRSQWPA